MLLILTALVAIFSFSYYNGFFLERTSFFGGPLGQAANAVGVSIGVEENEYNRIAQQLKERAEELDEKEKSLQEIEEEILEELREERREERQAFLFMSLGGVVMFGLISANFYYDIAWRRTKKEKRSNRS